MGHLEETHASSYPNTHTFGPLPFSIVWRSGGNRAERVKQPFPARNVFHARARARKNAWKTAKESAENRGSRKTLYTDGCGVRRSDPISQKARNRSRNPIQTGAGAGNPSAEPFRPGAVPSFQYWIPGAPRRETFGSRGTGAGLRWVDG